MSRNSSIVLMKVSKGEEYWILKHHPLSCSGRARSYWLVLFRVKEEG